MKEQNYLDHLVGVFGHPVSENPGVVIQEAAFRALGLDRWRFLTIDVAPQDIADAIAGLKAMKMRGINCTIPHKLAVIPYLDKIAPSAKLIGAVNTVINDGGVLTGENTDGQGFMIALDSAGISAKDKNVVVLGAGGAARAICVELALAGAAKLTIVNIPKDMALGEGLVKTLRDNTTVAVDYVPWVDRFRIPADTDIVVNATSIGLYPDVDARLDIVLDTLKPGTVVADVIVNPPKTHLLRDAEERGCTVVDGLGMLINQGVIGIKYWTGVDADPTVMRATLTEIFGASA
jgi:shikimate dehydrogenase